MMRILLVANTLPPDDISGVGEQVLQLAAGLESFGHQVRVLGRAQHGLRARKLLFPITVVPALQREIGEFRPHVVQVHESDGGLGLLSVASRRGLLDPPPRLSALLQVSYAEEYRSVRTLRHGGTILGRPGLQELIFKFTKAPLQVVLGCLSAYLSDVVLSPSSQTAREVSRDYRVEPVGVLPNVMGARDVPVEVDTSVADQRGFLLYVGRLRVRKALEVLLESLRTLGPDAPLLIVVGSGEHEPRLRDRARQLGLGERVRFLGRRSPGQVRALMSQAGALVVPSIYEGMPLVILEAMEAGLPVIASRVSGIPEVVRDGETGWLVSPEDPPALAGAISQWAGDADESRRRGRLGRDRLEEMFTARDVAEAWLRQVVESGAEMKHNPAGR